LIPHALRSCFVGFLSLSGCCCYQLLGSAAR
jgi:hypothetical protein